MRRLLLVAAFLIVLNTSGFGQGVKNQNSSCPSFPCIVASVSLTNQTGAFSDVTIYTPPADGFFRVAYYELVAPGPGEGWSFTWKWTDDFQEEIFGPFQLRPGNYFNAGIQGMHVRAGHAITYSVSPSNGVGEVYSLYATVEQLQ